MTQLTETKKITVRLAEVQDLDAASLLFDAYRVFYGQASNVPAANHFLFERMINHESVIYLAEINNQAVGFVQLYPGFSSVAMNAQWTLNDLYVMPEYRKQGVAEALINQSIELVKERGDRGLILETASDNKEAQALYKKLSFEKDEGFYHYYLWL